MRTVAVVVTHNSSLHVGACLSALAGSDVEVRVVDNASTDGTAAAVRQSFPDVELIANSDNVGFSRAVNQGIARVESDVVLLVNPDSVVPAATVAGLVAHLRAHPEVGIVGPRIVGGDGRAAISAHPFESLASVLLSRFGGSLIPVGLRRLVSGARRRAAYDACRRPDAPTDRRVDWLSGACLAVRASLLRGIGGLDERYFLYYEDEELCLQAWRRGYEVAYRPDLEATHIGGASSADVGATWPHLYRSMLIFIARHRRSTYQAVRAAVLVRALIGLSLAGVRVGLRRPGGRARGRAWHAVAVVACAGARRALTSNPAGRGNPA
jgi:N-acetylglucosaminyl-diphospho-decaprenol L-rhamnosyltransferase